MLKGAKHTLLFFSLVGLYFATENSQLMLRLRGISRQLYQESSDKFRKNRNTAELQRLESARKSVTTLFDEKLDQSLENKSIMRRLHGLMNDLQTQPVVGFHRPSIRSFPKAVDLSRKPTFPVKKSVMDGSPFDHRPTNKPLHLKPDLDDESLVAANNLEFDSRIRSLDERYEKLSNKVDVMDQQVVGSWHGPLNISGFFDFQYDKRHLMGESKPGQFSNSRFVLQWDSQINHRIDFTSRLQIDETDVLLSEAYLDYHFTDNFAMRTGIIPVPVGRYNQMYDSPLRNLNRAPLVNQYIVPVPWFDAGAGVFGSWDWMGFDFSYEVYAMNGLSDHQDSLHNLAGLVSLQGNGLSSFEIDKNNKAFTSRIHMQISTNTEIGASFYRADVGAYTSAFPPALPRFRGERFLNLWAFDYSTKLFDRLYWFGEFDFGFVNRNITKVNTNSSGYDFFGWYSQFEYSIDEEDRARAIARFGKVDTATDFQNEYDMLESVFGFSYRPSEQIVYRLEHHWEYRDRNRRSRQVDQNGLVFGVATYF